MEDFWIKQPQDKPAFEDLLWSRPESRHTAGKLLIIGGNIHSFAAVGQAYQSAQTTGIGTIRVIMPDSLQKTVSKLLPEAGFAISTPSGSFSQAALGEFLEQADWADAVLIAGDLGRNSETAILLEKFVTKYKGQLILTKDAVDYFSRMPASLIDRPDTCLVLTLAQLQLIASAAKSTEAFTFNLDLIQLIEKLHKFTADSKVNLIIKHLNNMVVAVDGQVSTTKTDLGEEDSWRVSTAARASVWWLQNPSKTFEALTTSLAQN